MLYKNDNDHFNFQDNRDTLRSLHSSMGHSATPSEIDDCLQPKSRAPLPVHAITSFSSTPPLTGEKFWPSASHMTSDGSCAPQNQHNWNQERLRYAQARGFDPNTICPISNSDGSSLRYCGDSIAKCEDTGSDEYDSGRSQVQVGTLKVELPVDEDDYLMPSPQQTHTASTYLDLMGDSKITDNVALRTYPEFSTPTNIDNPEYLMSNDSSNQAICIPTVSELVQNNGNVPLNSTHPYQPQRSSEEESDHEYYNDFDRLQRELQPLKRKGETTV